MTNVVVCREWGMRDAPFDQVRNTEKMVKIDTTWQGVPVSCMYFSAARNAWNNEPASMVAGRQILGNAVLFGVTAAQVAACRPTASSWLGLAAALPKSVPLTDTIRENRLREQAERDAEQRERFQQKEAQRRRINLRTATIDLVTGRVLAADGTDDVGEFYEDEDVRAAFAEWEEQSAAGR